MAHRGAGAPPAHSKGGGGADNRAIYHLTETVKKSDNTPLPKMVKSLKLRAGTKNQPILTLDDFQNMDDGYSVNLHMFELRGTKGYVVLTGIDRTKWTFDRKDKKTGVMGKVTYTDLRRLILVTQTWTQRMTTNAERAKGWRGSLFEVSRSEPTKEMRNGQERVNWKDSPRIGDVWYFTEKFDEEKLKAEFEKRAAEYGMPVERFIQPLDYDVLLKSKSHQELLQVANDIKSDGSAVKAPEATAGVSDAVSIAASSTTPETAIDY